MSAARSRRSATRRCSSASCAASTSSGPPGISGCRPRSSPAAAGALLRRSIGCSPPRGPSRAIRRRGAVAGARHVNLVLIALIVAAILLSANWHPGVAFTSSARGRAAEPRARRRAHRHCAPVALADAGRAPAANGFTWEPIREVAKLFAAIFVAIIPVLAMLHAGRRGRSRSCSSMVTAPTAAPSGRLFLADGAAVGVPRQRAHLSRVLRARRRRRPG